MLLKKRIVFTHFQVLCKFVKLNTRVHIGIGVNLVLVVESAVGVFRHVYWYASTFFYVKTISVSKPSLSNPICRFVVYRMKNLGLVNLPQIRRNVPEGPLGLVLAYRQILKHATLTPARTSIMRLSGIPVNFYSTHY